MMSVRISRTDSSIPDVGYLDAQRGRYLVVLVDVGLDRSLTLPHAPAECFVDTHDELIIRADPGFLDSLSLYLAR
jgi:hypothetical protein